MPRPVVSADRPVPVTAPMRGEPPVRLAGVIAVVGCDGSGKSTLTADLLAALRDEGPTRWIYLGQSSGNILGGIRTLPLLGPAVGRYLVRRSERAHAKEGRSASPDAVTALVVYLLSCWRYLKFRRLRALDRRGMVVITDRYPQAEVTGFYFDGPGLDAEGQARGFVGWLAGRERRLYARMSACIPALLIRLDIDVDTAYRRKPDHKLTTLREKVRVLPGLRFNGAPILDLDSRRPYAEVRQAALLAARAALAARLDRRP